MRARNVLAEALEGVAKVLMCYPTVQDKNLAYSLNSLKINGLYKIAEFK